jgi:predicted dehydrogenase
MGGWGRDWLKVVRAAPAVEAVTWVDANPDALAACVGAGLPAKRCYASLSEALAKTGADAALVTANVGAHAPVAEEAIAAGLDVLLEKPFAPSLEAAARVVDSAERAGRILMVSQNYRYHPAPRAAARIVAEGQLGAVGSVSVDFRFDMSGLQEGSPYLTITQPLLLDMAIHHFDLMRLVLGREPASVYCHAYNPPWSRFRDPATANASIDFGGGTVVSYRGSWASPAPRTHWAGEWRVECEDGEFSWTSRDNESAGAADRLVVRRRGKRSRTLPMPVLERYDRAGALAAFAAAVASREEPECSGRDNLRTLGLALAAIRSAGEGRPIDLN